MVRLYFLAAEQASHVRGEVFNVGGGIANSLSLIELFAMLEEITNTQLIYTKLPSRKSDQLVFVADIAKVNRLLGWEPVVSVKQGVTRMIAWVEALCA
jgi:CDP-paratose 2-epimerase